MRRRITPTAGEAASGAGREQRPLPRREGTPGLGVGVPLGEMILVRAVAEGRYNMLMFG